MKLLFAALFSVLILSTPLVKINAADGITGQGTLGPSVNSPSADSGGVKLTDPLGFKDNPKAPQMLIGRVINGALGIVGSLALLMFIYGGFTWMTAAGNQENFKKGKDIIVWSALGLVLIFSAYALTNFIFRNILQSQ